LAVEDLALFEAPGHGKLRFNDGWGFVCGHLWSGHLGFWLKDDNTNNNDERDNTNKCPAPTTREWKNGVAICTAYLFQVV
jgi:hypothetical protein